MPVKFTPNGFLDVATDPSDLPSQIVDKIEVSGAMQRCTNLFLDDAGIARTRAGSRKRLSLGHAISEAIVQGGIVYSFGQKVVYRENVQIGLGLGFVDGDWSALLYNPYNSDRQSIYATNGSNRIRIEGSSVYGWGIAAPTTAPTIGIGSLTGLTGSYKAIYTYCRKEGTAVVSESNPSSEAAAAVTLSNQSLTVTPTAPWDPQVTHIRIYRTVAGGSVYFHDQDISASTVSADSNTVDTALGTEVETDHYRPPLNASMVFGPSYNGYCFALVGNKLYFSKPKQPDYWPLLYYVECGPVQFPLKSMSTWGGYLYCGAANELYQIQGTGAASFFPIPVKATTGVKGKRGFTSIKGYGLLHVGLDGIYLMTSAITGSGDGKITDARFGPIFRGETKGSIPGVARSKLDKAILFFHKGRVWFGYPSAAATYCDNFLVTTQLSGKTVHYSYGKEFVALIRDDDQDMLLGITDDGDIWELDTPHLEDDEGTAISWQIESKAYSDQLYKYFPRYAKYDIALEGTDATAQGQILLNEEVKQTHVIRNSRDTSYRLITGCTGDRLTIKATGSGKASIYAIEVE